MSEHPPRPPAKIAIASAQAIYLRGLSALVMSMPFARLVGEARNPAEALQLCRLTVPDLLLLDLCNSTIEHCREVVRQVRQDWSSTRTILLAGAQEEALDWGELDDLVRISRDVSEEEFKAALEQIWDDCCWRVNEHASFQHQPEAADAAEWDELTRPQAAASQRSEEILSRELVMAGRIQEDILPEKVPSFAGWEFAARLRPARETSGDFYDFIPLSGSKLGLVIADVTDKGMGAALFMALSSSLLRTYAVRFPTLPGLVLNAVSERILSDTRGGMFVTAFYGVLEPFTGRFIFANAGHPPGLQISRRHGRVSIDRFNPTGMALGVSEDAQWKQKVIKLAPGDFVVLYTDGITEANNPQGDFFGEERLLDVLLAKANQPAAEILEAVLDEVHRFVGHPHAQDDIALIVIRRSE
jgi:DNA-binding NarL/FixJ family response regulator